jgi:nucleolar protein 56
VCGVSSRFLMVKSFVLFEAASGFALFERTQDGADEIASQVDAVQEAAADPARFGKMVRLVGFVPFASAEDALIAVNDVSEGVLCDTLRQFLLASFPKVKAGSISTKYELGVSEEKLGAAIQDEIGLACHKNSFTMELLRGIRQHFTVFLKDMSAEDLSRAQLGLGHSYSRAKVKFNVHRADNNIIQCISLLDQLDKDLNTFSMRCREWYSWHFPELSKIVTDHAQYAALARLIKNKEKLSEDMLQDIEDICGDQDMAQRIVDAARQSMGQDISPVDLINIMRFSTRVVELSAYRQKLHEYLVEKMHDVAPNLTELIGEQVGARLIAQAGSLTSLAKYPASTVQILGAEKALFRALKTKGNTPKYGLIFHSTFIGRAGAKNKGRISRYLANKCSIAARIDCFSDNPTNDFGKALKQQVEDRLAFYTSGEAPRKNIDVMKETAEIMRSKEEAGDMDSDGDDASDDADMAESAPAPEASPEKRRSKKEKREKKGKKERRSKRAREDDDVEMADESPVKRSKKSKKDKKGKKSKKSRKE